MKTEDQKKKKPKQSGDLKDKLCDIVKQLDCLSETDKKLTELVEYCSRGKRERSETSR